MTTILLYSQKKYGWEVIRWSESLYEDGSECVHVRGQMGESLKITVDLRPRMHYITELIDLYASGVVREIKVRIWCRYDHM